MSRGPDTLISVDLLDGRSFERSIDLGYRYALEALESAESKVSTPAEPQSVAASVRGEAM
jgi:hypothetical protein